MTGPAFEPARIAPPGRIGSIAAALLAVACLASPAAASDDVRVFVGAVGMYSWLPFAEDEFGLSGGDLETDTSIDDSLGGALVYGAQLRSGLSFDVDAEFTLGHEVSQEASSLGVPFTTVTDDLWILTLSSNVGYHPIDSFFDPYVSVGMGVMHAEFYDEPFGGTGFTLRGAVGINLWIGDHFGLRAEGRYLRPFGPVEDLDSVAPRAGVFARF